MRVGFVGDDISLQTFQIIIGLHLQDITAKYLRTYRTNKYIEKKNALVTGIKLVCLVG